MALDDEVEDSHAAVEGEGNSDSDEETSSESSDISDFSDATASQPKKCKKKKKKKKKRANGAGAAAGDRPEEPVVSKQESDKRFASAVQGILADDEDFLWVRLDKCNLHESKTRKLAEALEKNKHLTSLDLSGNQLNNDAVQSLSQALENGAAPELIFLDLRNNPFGIDGEDALETLQRARKHLTIEVRAPEPAQDEQDRGNAGSDAASANGDGGSSESGGADWALNQDNGSDAGPGGRLLTASPMHNAIAPYFQAGSGSEQRDNIPDQPEAIASRLWSEVVWGYEESPQNIPRMGAALHAIVQCCDEELALFGAGPVQQHQLNIPPVGKREPPKGRFASLRPHTRAAAEHLKLCGKLLAICSPEILTPSSRGDTHPTVGTHRMAVAEVTARLVSMGLPAVDQEVADLQLLPQLMRLCLDRPCCAALQVMCLRMVRSALDSSETRLWSVLLQPNLGLSADKSKPLESRPRLHRHLALIGESAHGVKPGRHSCDVGFAIALADILRARYDQIASLQSSFDDVAQHDMLGGSDGSGQESASRQQANGHGDILCEASLQLSELLEGDEAWQDFAMPEGTLDDFLAVTEGELCGPRPHRGLFGAGSLTTGQVLPSTHVADDSQDDSPPEHVALDIDDQAEGEGAGISVPLTNGQLRSVVNRPMPGEGSDWG